MRVLARTGSASPVQGSRCALQPVQDGWSLGALGVTEIADGVPLHLRPQALDLAARSPLPEP
ncbi:hypothetical protein ACWD4O_31665 [Streptomyces sp. NPDC002623]